MTDQDRFDKISRQFEKSLKPKLVIEKLKPVERLVVAVDGTKNAAMV